MRRIPTFLAGTHRDMRGVERTFSDEDLAATAEAYDPALAPAQLVKGHPTLDDPSFGQVGRFVVGDDGVLYAEDVQNLDVGFGEEVQAGRFPSRSIKFYTPGDPANPKPGVWYPRHIGFLGAHPPAVKGLPAVEFAEADDAEGIVVAAFGEMDAERLVWPLQGVFRMLRGVRDFIVQQVGAEAADAILPSADLEWSAEDLAREHGRALERADDGPSFSEPAPAIMAKNDDTSQTPEDREAAIAAREAAAEAREAAAAAREAAFAERAVSQVRAEFDRELDAIAAEGRLIGTDREDVVAFCEATGLFGPGEDGSGVEVQFGEGDDIRTEGALDFMASLLRRLPVEVAFGEVAPDGTPADASDPGAIAKAATSYQAEQSQKGISVSASDAVSHVLARRHG